MVITTISLYLPLLSVFFVPYFFNALFFGDDAPAAHAFDPIPSPLNQSQTTNDNASSLNQANHRPVAENLNITILGTSPVGFTLKGTDQDENEKLNYTILTEPVYGEIRMDPATGAVTYDPHANWDGDAFTYKATDTGGQDSDVGVVTISLQAPK